MVNPRAVPPITTMMTSERTTPTTEANSVEGACTAEKSLVHLLLWRLEQLSPTLRHANNFNVVKRESPGNNYLM